MSVGSHQITVSYGGDANYQSSETSVTFPVARAATELVLSSSTAQIGQTVTPKATVVAPVGVTPGGTMDFFIGGKPIASCTGKALQGGSASCDTQLSQLGSYSVTANYSGDKNLLRALPSR